VNIQALHREIFPRMKDAVLGTALVEGSYVNRGQLPEYEMP